MNKLSGAMKAQIALEAQRACRAQMGPLEACPWPYGSQEGRHWIACWILAGGTLS